MKQPKESRLFHTHFENKEWYDERVKFYKFVIVASVGIFSALLFSWEKLPSVIQAKLDETYYQYSLILSGITAVLGLLAYYFTFRNRFFVPNARENLAVLYKYQNKYPKTIAAFRKTWFNKVIKNLYYCNARIRVRTDPICYYLTWGMTQFIFILTLLATALLLVSG